MKHIMLYFLYFITIFAIIPKSTQHNGEIALTFDDGPTYYTREILDYLENEDIQVTFHFTTQNIVRPEMRSLIMRAAEEGHTIGLRLDPSRNYDGQDKSYISSDIKKQLSVLGGAIGKKIKFVRANMPSGIVDPVVEQVALENDLILTRPSHSFYNDKDTLENARDNIELFFKIASYNDDSFIILLHDEMEEYFPILETIVKHARNEKFNFVNLDKGMKGYIPGQDGLTRSNKGSKLTNHASIEILNIIPLCLMILIFV
ncbi:Polysaccharide deacetylase domain-containing protein [Astathelohania contejeani]|uniref:Polysaccharide deacetylase domain-containing protein n=1 Tax=Astathelohania contejeani TaxID=164912 RepID=A0ABQ7I195_9MICR|nr:Polysaccharide deacetylase domain-containing protein [Thelohania contejeani]